MKRLFATMVLSGMLASCASAPTGPPPVAKIEVREVIVPVASACVPKDMPDAPAYPDSRGALKAAPAAEDRFRLMAAGWFLRDARLTLLEGIVRACADPK